MIRCPASVVIVGLILCIQSVLSGLDILWLTLMKGSPFGTLMHHAPILAIVQVGIILTYGVLQLVSGVLVLKGVSIVRWLYPICFVAWAIIQKTTSGDNFQMDTTFIFQGILILFLFLPQANAYFRSRSHSER